MRDTHCGRWPVVGGDHSDPSAPHSGHACRQVLSAVVLRLGLLAVALCLAPLFLLGFGVHFGLACPSNAPQGSILARKMKNAQRWITHTKTAHRIWRGWGCLTNRLFQMMIAPATAALTRKNDPVRITPSGTKKGEGGPTINAIKNITAIMPDVTPVKIPGATVASSHRTG